MPTKASVELAKGLFRKSLPLTLLTDDDCREMSQVLPIRAGHTPPEPSLRVMDVNLELARRMSALSLTKLPTPPPPPRALSACGVMDPKLMVVSADPLPLALPEGPVNITVQVALVTLLEMFRLAESERALKGLEAKAKTNAVNSVVWLRLKAFFIGQFRACTDADVAYWYAKLSDRACVKAPSEWVAPKLTQDAWMAMLLVAAAENWVKPPALM